MSLLDHAKTELDIIGMLESDTDTMNSAMRKHILYMVDEFAKEGHSGFSASYTVAILKRLLAFEPLSPLTGEDSEWTEVSDLGGVNGGPNKLFQNKRCSRIFKDNTGAWDIDGKVFVESNGSSYTNSDSKVTVTFPYTPITEYVEVDTPTNDTN